MINTEKSFNINDYIEIILRRIWYIIIPFIVVLIIVGLYACSATKEYRASTLILVTPQKVPVDYVRPTVTSTIEDRLQSIGQEIMSRTRLERVISEFKLYEEEAKSTSPEEVVKLMRKNIQIEIRGKEGYFTISYIGKDPKVVTMVTNKLASLFIEENLKLREQQAQGTTEFLSIELNATRAKLEEQEKAVTQFKKQFMKELPENREANLKVLDQFQLQYQRVSDSLRGAQDRKLIIQKQLNELKLQMEPTVTPETLKGKEASISDSLSLVQPSSELKGKNPDELQLKQLRGYLSDLQTRYTEKHPDILMAKKKIADLENKIEKVKPMELAEESLKPEKVEEKVSQESNPFYKEMESQLTATEYEIKRLKDEESKLKSKIGEFQMRVENAPTRELAMINLTRDYQNAKETYQSLLKKRQEAQQSENLEQRQKGEQFKVIDPARVPEKPFKPDIPKILLFGLLLGIVSGFGIAFSKEQMDHSFRDAEDLEVTLGFKVLANIPKVEKKAA
jgi:polysaccharide chain length determinant protein (PEP-CTERM system associated)